MKVLYTYYSDAGKVFLLKDRKNKKVIISKKIVSPIKFRKLHEKEVTESKAIKEKKKMDKKFIKKYGYKEKD